ncbi:uncharacterized protein A1O9_11403 [Exophiala aquamarina CBS 119918]|uniref:Transcription factor domain-containing protein n=1 Tax=Exophiala aquamarina CBS 119918 TaxID=1182545 RepID=A0A072PAE1_9EURO|nr:uncharacterized protein A1O9_11403 [Exophiala aquamarina CBS 119918]KEF52560.1 hypothetical protein A1O9_11403 [Exophiala aquamarina CBS 119918]
MLINFLQKLQVRDTRYDMVFAYGALLFEIPKRLGTNAALDASVMAMTSAIAGIEGNRKSPEILTRYGNALRSLKTCLDDPVAVQSSSTLCAIYIIWICQAWICPDENMSLSGHSSGIVKLLATVPYKDSADPFDRGILLTIAGPVVFESLVDPTIKLNPWLKKVVLENERPLVEDGSEDTVSLTENYQQRSQVGRVMSSVIRIPEFLQYNPELLNEIISIHRDVQKTCIKLHAKLIEVKLDFRNQVFLEMPKQPRIPISPNRLYAFYQKLYGIFLNIEVMFNGILQAYNPRDATLAARSSQICQEIIDLSLAALDLRPLGAGWIPICFISAWAATSNEQSKALLEEAWYKCWATYSMLDLPSCGKQSEKLYQRLRQAVANANMIRPESTFW